VHFTDSYRKALTEEASEIICETEHLGDAGLLKRAAELSRSRHRRIVSFSKKVFIPLTRLCRDVCGYCTFATTPRQVKSPYLSPEEVLSIAQNGKRAGCKEALFTLGDKPELRYEAARRHLAELGYASTFEYVHAMCALVLRETGLFPHVNAGVMTEDDIRRFKEVSVSQGLMLEGVSPRLSAPGGAHYGSPDKEASVRIATLEAAGRAGAPFTSGILIGIGETRLERVEALLVLRDLHAQYGHLQETIVQNFRAKAQTRMAKTREPGLDDLLWTTATARIVLGAQANIQVPPNLSFDSFPELLSAGINDWGGVSPVTPDHVNPEAPWPEISRLESESAAAGYQLVERLAVYPDFAMASGRWQTRDMRKRVLEASDTLGFAREGNWEVGKRQPVEFVCAPSITTREKWDIAPILDRAIAGDELNEEQIVSLFSARGGEVNDIREVADDLRRRHNGDKVGYVVNRNINYTNVCLYRCSFCAFSKGRKSHNPREKAYDLAADEIARRVLEAASRGATEVCMQGGINPRYTGQTYIDLVNIVKDAVPEMHVHAFSPLEVFQGAATLDISVSAFLDRLQRAGLGSLPGTAAEILDDSIRAQICPDKLSTAQWLNVIESAHTVGLKTTATIMFGHVEDTRAWARHLLHVRNLQKRTGGFTEFVPLAFVHMEAPMFLREGARKGPTWREVILMHAVSRLVLNPHIRNIQASWVKLSPQGAAQLLTSGVNDLGGTLMNESISNAAGTEHGQEMPPEEMERLIGSMGRVPVQRSTLYGTVSAERRGRSFNAPELVTPVFTSFAREKKPDGVRL
jgi:FO synthase